MNIDRFFAPYHPPASNLADRLRYWAAELPDETAFCFWNGEDDNPEDRLTFSQLDRRARAVAAELISRRLSGQRALLLHPPGLDFVSGLFGCLYAGVIAVPAYPPRRSRNMERIGAISEDAQAAIVLSTRDTTDRAASVTEQALHLRQLPWLANDAVPDHLADTWEPPPISPDDLAILQYTSGSTGAPKGVMLSHRNLIHNCELISYGFEPSTRGDRGLFWLPTYHDMGLVGGILVPLFLGGPSILMSPLSFLQHPVRWLRGISRFRATISGGPNFAYALCAEKIAPEECAGLDLSSWSVAFTGAEPIRAETLDAFAEKFAPYGFRAAAPYPCYGMAETTLLITGGAKREPPIIRDFDSKALDAHRVELSVNGQVANRRLVSSGRVLPGEELLIVDPDACVQVPGNHVGEIWVRSPSVAQGYWNKPAETERTFHARLSGRKEKFLRTGDLGFLHEGELYVTGRCKDLIIIRGRNLYPHDVEATVEKCHSALRSAAGACFSVDIAGEERLVVVHELDRQHRLADSQSIIEAIRQAVLEEHEAPLHCVCLLKPGRLPKTSSGKVQRSACREFYLRGELETIARWSDDPPGDRAASLSDGGGVESAGRSSESPGGDRPAPRAAAALSAGDVQAWLVSRVAARLRRDPTAVDIHEPFARFGLDSLALVELSGELEKFLGRAVSPLALYSYPDIAALAEHLAEGPGEVHHGAAAEAKFAEPIAVVGLACRFPGADDPEEYWRLLRDGADAIGPIPPSRWDASAFYSPDPDSAGTMYTQQGGFISGVDQFDPRFFGIAPREATAIDPQQRLLLEIAWETLENAGAAADRVAGSSLGIFVGISNSDYAHLQARGEINRIDAYTGTGTAFSIAAGRLAYALGVHGPCLAIDTACSSSLVAVHLAVQSLRKGECQSALAGGVNLILDPSSSVALCRLQALARDGRCKTFDAAADGYGRGEGCGMVLLKRLSEALTDGDQVWAVIRGSAVNHDGRSNGLTAPHGPSQEALLRAALSDADVRPEDIGYIEAHGTGTSLGDPIEMQALSAVLGPGRDPSAPLMVGSAKTNIGHLEAAAGVAGLIKLVLALRHGQIPPHLHLHTPNPYIPWDSIPVRIPTALTPWPQDRRRRIAGVSSFGFSGTNAHVVLEESPQPRATAQTPRRPAQLLVLSAKDETALRELAERYAAFLDGHVDYFADICQTAAVGRSHFAHRLAIISDHAAGAAAKLRQFVQGERAEGVFVGRVDEQRRPQVAFLCTGQGAQFVGMAQGLYRAHPTFRAALDRCDALLSDHLPERLLSVLFGQDDPAAPLHQTLYTQPALFAVEYALAQLWKSWGVQPDHWLGHSVGEYVGACELGVFQLADALRLLAARGRLIQNLPAAGAMVSVAADESTIRPLLLKANGHIDIAAVNSPRQTVLSGPTAALNNVVSVLEGAGLRTSRLRVSHAFHSSLMEPMLAEFDRLCREVQPAPPQREFASSLYGRLVTNEVASPDYWREQIRHTVRFADGLAALDARGVDVYVELGPKPILTACGRQCLADHGQLWLASLRVGRDDWSQILECVAELHVRGVAIDWPAFYRDEPRRKMLLPNYPFQRSRHWVDLPAQAAPGAQPADPARTEAQQAESLDDWLFEVQWQPRSRFEQRLVRRPADYIPATATLRDAVRPETDRLRTQLQLPRYVELSSALEQLSVAFVWDALRKLGWRPVAGQVFDAVELAQQFGVTGKLRLFVRLLEMLSEDGLLKFANGGWTLGLQPPPAEPSAAMADLQRRYPECSAELTLFGSCAGNLAEVLRGDIDPLQLLFPQGSTELVERLYRDSPFARSLNALLDETLGWAVSGLPADRTLKILEIGGGTGGTTAHILPRLPADRTEYLFTDVSQVFMHEAAAKFRQYPFLRYGVLDIESDPAAQGYAEGQFDVIVAANVLHATRDLRQSLAHIRRLLAPQGALVLLEGTRPQRWLDLIFGLTDGWWRFADDGVRTRHPLVSAETWRRLLTAQHFTDIAALGEQEHDGETGPPQMVLFARAGQSTAAPPIAAEAPLAPVAPTSADGGSWMILADQGGVGSALADALRAAGQSVLLVDRQQVRDLPQLMAEEPLQGIVHLWGLDAAAANEISVSRLQEAEWLACESAVEVLQHLIPLESQPQPRMWLVTRGAQHVICGEEVPGLAQSPLWGLGRVVAEEQPTLWGGLVDLDPGLSIRDSAQRLCDDLLNRDSEDQIAYRRDQRYAARLVRRQKAAGLIRPIRWRTDASYLVTGGLGDVGLRVTQWMVEQGAHHLVICARTPLPARDQWEAMIRGGSRQGLQLKAIQELEARGATIHVAAVDVTDENSLRSLFQELSSMGWPPLRGVFHAAGQADAQALTAITHERLTEVLGPKILGGWLLHHLLRHERLDFFVCCSSGAALLPSPLLGVYAAASSFPDALAHHRRSQGLAALTVNWGFWEQTANLSPALRAIGPGIVPVGMRPFNTAQGLAALRYLLEHDAVNTAVMPVDLEVWRKHHPGGTQSSLLAHLRNVLSDSAAAAQQADGGDSARSELLAAPPEGRRKLAEEFLRDEISRVLRIPSARLETHQSLNNLGIDSLMAVELRNHVQARMGVTIPLAKLLQDPTIAQLAELILQQLGDAPPAAAGAAAVQPPPLATSAVPVPPPIEIRTPPQLAAAKPAVVQQAQATTDIAATLERIDELSDAEVERVLRQMLSQEQPQK